MFTELFMHIRFTALWPCYVVLLDSHDALRGLAAEVVRKKVVIETSAAKAAMWRSLDVFGRCIYRPPSTTGRRHPKAWPALVMAPMLVVPTMIAGAAGTTQAWPFACYPTFQWLAGEEIPHLSADAVHSDGGVSAIALEPTSQRDWGVVWSVVGATHGPVSHSRVRAYWRERGPHVPDATSIRVYRAYRSVVPERWGQPPVRRVLIAVLACPAECAPPRGSRAR
jgi:hypothetical protein